MNAAIQVQKEHSEMVNKLAKSGQVILETLTPNKCHLWHMVTGVMGEMIELKDYTNIESLLEELGDLEFYLGAIREHYGIPYGLEESQPPQLLSLPETIGWVLSASGDLVDNMKKELIYCKPKTEDVKRALVDVTNAMVYVYSASGLTREDALVHNMNKLLKGKNARYSSGSYSDQQAQERSDKQGGEE